MNEFPRNRPVELSVNVLHENLVVISSMPQEAGDRIQQEQRGIFGAESDGGLEVQTPSQWMGFQSEALREVKSCLEAAQEMQRTV